MVGIGLPPGFIESLGELPENVRFREDMTNQTGLALCFVRTKRDLEATIGMLAAKLPRGTSAWMIWPKAHHKPGFNGNDVRNIALPQGLVDYKICSIDADWSGMKFAWRKT